MKEQLKELKQEALRVLSLVEEGVATFDTDGDGGLELSSLDGFAFIEDFLEHDIQWLLMSNKRYHGAALKVNDWVTIDTAKNTITATNGELSYTVPFENDEMGIASACEDTYTHDFEEELLTVLNEYQTELDFNANNERVYPW